MDTNATQASPQQSAGAGPEIVFDPFRFAGAVKERWRWIAISSAAAFTLLLAAGLVRVSDKHEGSARLIKREPPATFRAGEVGEAFRPRTLGSATLVASALSDNVLSRVSAQSEPPISLGRLRLAATAAELRGTDFLQLTVKDTRSKKAASDLVNLWAREIVQFSQDMQTRESREVQTYLQQQIEATDSDLAKVNSEILDFSRRENLLDADKQTDSFLRQVADLDLRYETARIDLQTVEFKQRALEAELARYGAANDRLVSARAELRDARARFTDRNPIVQNLQAKVAALEAEVSKTPDSLSLADFASTAIGGNLYLELLDLRARRSGAEKQLAGLAAMRDQAHANIAGLPEKVAALARLKLGQRGLETARQLLSARLREAALFAERAPGYYQVFSSCTPDSVATTSRYVKIAVFAIAGLVLGAGAGLLVVALREIFDQRLRSAFEAKRVFKAPVLAALAPEASPAEVVGSLWMTWATSAARQGRPAVLWAPRSAAEESALWDALLAEAARLQPELKIVDAGAAPSPVLSRAERLDPSRLTLSAAHEAARRYARTPQWARMAGDTVEPSLTLARLWGGVVVVVAADAARISEWQAHARLLRDAEVPVHGIIVLNALPWWKRGRK